ncbi:MAG: hypothetical protein K9G49_01635 [Taibaiella sp.]|nr:hypothetical protein [Taibaiella sp.]
MFLTEKHLVSEIKDNYASMCNWDSNKFDTKVVEEVNLGFGVADLVISKIKPKEQFDHVDYLNYFDISIYKIIESSNSISFDELKNITRANDASIKRSLKKLMVSSYVNNEDSIFYIRKSYQKIVTDLIAIEAKLKNWRRALDQAYRYKWFAKKSFVVLDAYNIKPALFNLNQFKKLNIGLAEINTKGSVIIHFNPRKCTPIDDKMLILFNEEIKKLFFCPKK